MNGLVVALFIFFSWLFALIFGLTQGQVSNVSEGLKYFWLMIIIQLLFVGLFITVHDACHGSVAPNKPRINLWIGRIFAFAYAAISFDTLARKHQEHHRYSGTKLDPDFYRDGTKSFFPWFFHFLKQYISLKQILIMTGVAQVLIHVVHLPEANVFIFWVIPSILSLLQLFYFGTYLPHKKRSDVFFEDSHHTLDVRLPLFISFVSCYHFGAFHHSHHQFPGTSWFLLPRFKRKVFEA
ncbi:MAG: fatty acid desaturase [Bdellovibrio sp.]|nr:fatty acid desaturase [Bdellovibrio sp.]